MTNRIKLNDDIVGKYFINHEFRNKDGKKRVYKIMDCYKQMIWNDAFEEYTWSLPHLKLWDVTNNRVASNSFPKQLLFDNIKCGDAEWCEPITPLKTISKHKMV